MSRIRIINSVNELRGDDSTGTFKILAMNFLKLLLSFPYVAWCMSPKPQRLSRRRCSLHLIALSHTHTHTHIHEHTHSHIRSAENISQRSPSLNEGGRCEREESRCMCYITHKNDSVPPRALKAKQTGGGWFEQNLTIRIMKGRKSSCNITCRWEPLFAAGEKNPGNTPPP